ncbi:MAG: dihydroneopterin aldolase [Verrucomicrobiae bacterium]|nr:dihydroneopterin aldolase [Verrucomicrobiae bacterium]NNJ86887.1 dihydroneopterin aldolase [Akkermansiaceae bacterium]
MKKSDQIFIRGQVVSSHIGVPDSERAHPQDLLINSFLHPLASKHPLNDDIDRTVDYHAVSLRIDEIAAAKPRKLIETLAEDLAAMILDEFPVSKVTIEIEKFILPNTTCVGVSITRKSMSKTSG